MKILDMEMSDTNKSVILEKICQLENNTSVAPAVYIVKKILAHRTSMFGANAASNVNEVTIKDLNYINQFNYDAYARLGYKAISIVAYYRMNDMFSVSNIAPVVYEMPRLRLGISLGM